MQFHHDGFRMGDPEAVPAAPGYEERAQLNDGDAVDVLVVGTGPAGLVLAAQLSRFPEITTRVVERRDGPRRRAGLPQHGDARCLRTQRAVAA